eukprot:1844781-Ditylum_brightwellii.AAC.1
MENASLQTVFKREMNIRAQIITTVKEHIRDLRIKEIYLSKIEKRENRGHLSCQQNKYYKMR